MCNSGVFKKQQRLLKNMGAHKVMLDLLQIPYDRVGNLTVYYRFTVCTEFYFNININNWDDSIHV